MAASLISFLSIFYSINLNHVSRRTEQNTKRADTKPIAIAFVSEFEHVATEIITHCFYSLPNVPTHFECRSTNDEGRRNDGARMQTFLLVLMFVLGYLKFPSWSRL